MKRTSRNLTGKIFLKTQTNLTENGKISHNILTRKYKDQETTKLESGEVRHKRRKMIVEIILLFEEEW